MGDENEIREPKEKKHLTQEVMFFRPTRNN